MLDEAIALVEKQIELYAIQEQNITTYAKRQVIENKIKKKLNKQRKIWAYILKVLEKQKEEIDEKEL